LFLLISSVFILILFSSKTWWHSYQNWQWQHQLKLKHHLKNLQCISAPFDGFELSKQARQDNDAYEYVYGEIEPKSLIALISLAQPDLNTVFYDLGSGTGKAVFACAMVFDIKKSCGIELFPPLQHAAHQQLEHLNSLSEYQQHTKKITFICDNFLNICLADATLIFVSATGLFGETWIKLNHNFEQLQSNPIIITTSKKLQSPQFKVVRTTKVQMSWGVVKAYIQERAN
jgi:hypothetical protein